MNNIKLTFILLLMSSNCSLLWAQSATATSAIVHFYQGHAFGLFSAKYRIYANGKLLCKLGRNSHCQVLLPAGATTFTSRPLLLSLGTQPALTLTLEPGQHYYVQGDAKFTLLPPNDPLVLTQVVPNAQKLDQIQHAKSEPSLVTLTQ